MWTTCKKIKVWIRVVAAITLLCFISYDIAWAYPIDGHSTPQKLQQLTLVNSPEERVRNYARWVITCVNRKMDDFKGLSAPEVSKQVREIIDELEAAVAKDKTTNPDAEKLDIDRIIKKEVGDLPGQLSIIADGGKIVFRFFFPRKIDEWLKPEAGYKELSKSRKELNGSLRCQIFVLESSDYLQIAQIDEDVIPTEKEPSETAETPDDDSWGESKPHGRAKKA